MDLRLLGPLEVRLGDGPIELGPRKQRAVLAMLALEPGHTVSADRLAEGLWGDEPPASGAKMVQLYVSHLRRALDGNGASIATRGRGYELQLSDGDVDATLAQRLVDDARPREALALWRGEPLADLADEPFAAAEIRRLDELRLRATEMAIDADLAAGRHAEVIGELDALVARYPLRERLHAQRMLALYRAGRQSEALEAYSDARAALVEEIGVEPGVELRRLQEAILAQDPVLDLPAAADPEPATAPQAAPRRRSHALLVGAAALVLAGVLAFGIIRVLEPDGLAGIDEDHVGLIEPSSGRITDQYSVGRSPGAIAAGAGSVWVANRLDGTVSRITRARREVVTIPVGGEPTGLAFGAGSLWVADGQGRTVTQIDPQHNKVVQRYEVGNAARRRRRRLRRGLGRIRGRRHRRADRPDERQGLEARSRSEGDRRRWRRGQGRSGSRARTRRASSGSTLDRGRRWPASRWATDRAASPSAPARSGWPTGATGPCPGSTPTPARRPTSCRSGANRARSRPTANGVWVANAGDGTVMRIDPRSAPR